MPLTNASMTVISADDERESQRGQEASCAQRTIRLRKLYPSGTRGAMPTVCKSISPKRNRLVSSTSTTDDGDCDPIAPPATANRMSNMCFMDRSRFTPLWKTLRTL